MSRIVDAIQGLADKFSDKHPHPDNQPKDAADAFVADEELRGEAERHAAKQLEREGKVQKGSPKWHAAVAGLATGIIMRQYNKKHPGKPIKKKMEFAAILSSAFIEHKVENAVVDHNHKHELQKEAKAHAKSHLELEDSEVEESRPRHHRKRKESSSSSSSSD